MRKFQMTLFLVMLTLCSSSVFAQQKPLHEIYSMMVFNFIKYIQWPGASNSNQFVIGVVGNNEMFQTMNSWYNGNKIGTQTCVVKKYKSAAEVEDCQVVFVDRTKSGEFDAINNKVKGKNTLVITDKDGLGEKGSGINFKIVDNKLKFELNQRVLESSNLKVASALSSMAILI